MDGKVNLYHGMGQVTGHALKEPMPLNFLLFQAACQDPERVMNANLMDSTRASRPGPAPAAISPPIRKVEFPILAGFHHQDRSLGTRGCCQGLLPLLSIPVPAQGPGKR